MLGHPAHGPNRWSQLRIVLSRHPSSLPLPFKIQKRFAYPYRRADQAYPLVAPVASGCAEECRWQGGRQHHPGRVWRRLGFWRPLEHARRSARFPFLVGRDSSNEHAIMSQLVSPQWVNSTGQRGAA